MSRPAARHDVIIRYDHEDGGNVSVFRCGACEAVIKERLTTETIDPAALARRAESAGWKIELKRQGRNRCPECIAARPKNDPDSEIRKIIPMPFAKPTPIPEQVKGSVPSKAPSEKTPLPVDTIMTMSLKEAKDMGMLTFKEAEEAALAATPPSGKVPGQRRMTQNERFAIRTELDKHFDDSSGQYLADEDDARIASRLNVPRKWVEDLREAAYGPILIDKVAAARKVEIEAIKATLMALDNSLRRQFERNTTSISELTNAMRSIAERIAKLEGG